MDTARNMKTQLYGICFPLDILTCFTHQNPFYWILFITINVKPYEIPQYARISYVIDFIQFLINGRPKDGLLDAETCSHPNSLFNMILELCLTDFMLIYHQYGETNVMHFSSVYQELRASTSFEHYLLILRRVYTSSTWYIAYVLCQLAPTGLELNSNPCAAN
jgi:hypothetical protein